MSYEAGTFYPKPPEQQAEDVLEQEALRIKRLRETRPPMESLGEIVLGSLIGGALGGGGAIMPRTEVILLEGLSVTVEMADKVDRSHIDRAPYN